MLYQSPKHIGPYSRQSWIDKSDFSLNCPLAAFRAIADRVVELKQSGETPVVVVDLDGTVYDVRPRTLAIIQRWAIANRDNKRVSFTCDRLKALTTSQIQYRLTETLSGLSNLLDTSPRKLAAITKSIDTLWSKRFFSDWGVLRDKPYPTACKFISRLYELGATIVYLTGRHEKRDGSTKYGMVASTKYNLKTHDFPFDDKDPRTQLFFKENWEDQDAEFKDKIAERLNLIGVVAAIMENEPSNVVVMRQKYPEAVMAFAYTQCNDKAVATVKGNNLVCFEWEGVTHLRTNYR
ncbi:MAG: HAD family hydrolase [Bdellovibrionota bacterium]